MSVLPLFVIFNVSNCILCVARKRDKLIAEVEKLIKANKQLEARKKLNTQSHVSFEMVRKLIFALRQWNVHYLMAPFEADAQMAYLCRSGLADFAITEDQDLILYGCKKILFKFDKKNEIQQGLLYEQHRIRPEMSNLRFLTRLCILSGCDYVSNLPGFGLKKAEKFMVNHVGVDHSDEDFKTKIKLIPELLKMPKLENAISDEYIAKVLDAENTFNYQLVFCPIKKQVVPLTCYPEGVDHRDYKFCGHRLADDDAIKLARGSLDHSTLTVIEEDADYLERCDHDYLLDVRKQINKTISDWTTKWVAKELTNSQSSSQASQSSSSSWSSSQESSTDSKSGSQSQQLPKSTKRKKGAELIVTAIKKSRADPFSLDRYLSQDSKSSQKIEKEVVEVTTHSKYFKTEV